MGASTVFDEKRGIAYTGYNADLIRAFLILVHYTDLNTAEYDTPEGHYTLYDVIATHDLWPDILKIVQDDMTLVDMISMQLSTSARHGFEREHSLDYQTLKTFQSLLGTEDIAATIAKAEGLNTKLIELLGAVQKSPATVSPLQFAKKET